MVGLLRRGLLVGVGLVILIGASSARASHPDFDPNNLISDSEFIDIDGLSAAGVQRFLEQQGSSLKDFSENGRTAAQIIFDAAHGFGDGSGTVSGIEINTSTGTVNPEVILVTLQKEQSLVSKKSRDDSAFKKAMGYGCPDSGSCNPAYEGFTKQVENGAWQLRFNYERAKDRGFSDYQVGQTQSFSNADGTTTNVTFANRATASLYRYTPHVYNGNHNFHNLYVNSYNFKAKEYDASPVEWSSSDGRFTYPSIIPGGDGTNLVIKLKNTGRTSWKKGTVNLGTARGYDRVPGFLRESRTGVASGWISPNRVTLKEEEVAPGQIGTFDFYLATTADKPPGTYREYFELVADGITWFPSLGIYWEIKVLSPTEGYQASPVEWSSSDGSHVYPTIQRGGSGTNLVIKLKNTGKRTWTKGTVNLGTAATRDRIPAFERESGIGAASGWLKENRVAMKEAEVKPGETGTFDFWIRALSDKTVGTNRERFELVADGITWFPELGIYWDVTVR